MLRIFRKKLEIWITSIFSLKTVFGKIGFAQGKAVLKYAR